MLSKESSKFNTMLLQILVKQLQISKDYGLKTLMNHGDNKI